jgi:NAD(P)-dependent dehydrogenase (short-subunit alcohol dehydrogenase family)
VTGAGGSIGRACILQFARDGVQRIAGLDVSVDALKQTEAILRSQFPSVQFLSLQADLSQEKEVQDAFCKVADIFGRIDYAVNNAAIGGPFAPTADNTLQDLDRVLAVNLRGLWLCERAELQLMQSQEPLPSEEQTSRLESYPALSFSGMLTANVSACV